MVMNICMFFFGHEYSPMRNITVLVYASILLRKTVRSFFKNSWVLTGSNITLFHASYRGCDYSLFSRTNNRYFMAGFFRWNHGIFFPFSFYLHFRHFYLYFITKYVNKQQLLNRRNAACFD